MWFAGPARLVPEAGRPRTLRLGFDLKPGMRVGLYGGSFNPVHDGHVHVAETALKNLRLDRVVWLVSPQNPLKSRHHTAPLAERMAGVRARARGPAMIVSDAETRIGSQFTIDTVRVLQGALSRGAFRLDHGRRQPGRLPSLARLDPDHARAAGGGRLEALGGAQGPHLAGRQAVRPRPPSGPRRAAAGDDDGSGLGLSARPVQLRLVPPPSATASAGLPTLETSRDIAAPADSLTFGPDCAMAAP
jgi:cytidyltransferase-like protein